MSPRVRIPPLAILCALAPLTVPAPASAQSPEVAARVARIERDLLPSVRVQGRSYGRATIEQRMRELNVPAVSIAVVHNGEIQWARAYGLADVESGRAATPATLFQAASMSKPVAAMGALSLVQQGKLALDEDVNTRLVSWTVPANELTAKSPVTLRRLLTHSAGLTVHGFPGYADGQPLPTVVQILDGAPPANTGPVRVDIEPGSRWRYSGGGTTVAQLLVQDVTGQPFATFMRERVLAPIGMTSSTYEQPLPAERRAEAATAYRANGTPIPGRYHTYPEQAAAGLWTTPSDLARWIIEVQRSLAAPTGGVQSPATTAAMLTPGVGNWGLGPQLSGAGDSLRFSHGGSNAGFRGQFVGFARRGDGVAIMTNSDAGARLVGEILHAVAREYGWPGYAPQMIEPIARTPEQLAPYAGRYAVPGGPMVVPVERGDGVLWLTMPGGQRVELVPVDEDVFAHAVAGVRMRFHRDQSGQVVALEADGTRLTREQP